MSRFDEVHGKAKITGYRFLENDDNKAIDNGILFNFSPSHVRVGNQYIVSSTVELARTLVDLLDEQSCRSGQAGERGCRRGATE